MIILLNGCTSAGKTTLAKALQSALPGCWLRYGIDDAMAMVPAHYHDSPDGFIFARGADDLVRIDFGAVGTAAVMAYHRATVAMAAVSDLIVDDVMLMPQLRDDWIASLPDNTLLVGVHCPLAELERREVARGDRRVGQARGQMGHVHAGMRYDIEVDTGTMASEDCVRRIAEAVAEGTSGAALRRLRGVAR